MQVPERRFTTKSVAVTGCVTVMPARGEVATNEYHTSSSAVPTSPLGSGVMDCVAPATVPAVGTQVVFTGRLMAAVQWSLAGGASVWNRTGPVQLLTPVLVQVCRMYTS